MRAALIALALLAACPAARAADCAGAATQTEMNICYGAEFDAADAKLNTLYKQMTARLGGDAATKRLLVTTQRAWIAYRNAECDFQSAGVSGGSLYPTIRAMCLTGLTNARVADFTSFLSCEEGDLACPLPPG